MSTANMFKFRAVLDEGKFEKDSLTVTSPKSGKTKRVFLHATKFDTLTKGEKIVWMQVIVKARMAKDERKQWEYSHKPKDIHGQEWQDYIKTLRARYPEGMFDFWLYLTIAEAEVINKLTE